MRHKDDKKLKAISDAAIRLITENGFADTSMSKIARAAKVSPGTLYVYFDSQEEMLKNLYSTVKKEMGAALAKGLDPQMPVRRSFRLVWDNFYNYALENPLRFTFTEQFSNSPLVDEICREQSMAAFAPLFQLVERGKREDVLKDVSIEILAAFTFTPLGGLIKQHLNGEINLDAEMAASIFDIAWDAISV